MQLTAFLPLLALAAASPITARDATSVLSGIKTIETDIQTLNTTLNGTPDSQSFGFFALLAIQSQSDTLASDIQSTTGDANSSSVFTSAESQTIYTETNSVLKPQIFSLLDNFIRHYPGFKSGGVATTVRTSLTSQRELSRQLGNALAAKAVEPYKTQAGPLTQEILSKFDSAITKFST